MRSSGRRILAGQNSTTSTCEAPGVGAADRVIARRSRRLVGLQHGTRTSTGATPQGTGEGRDPAALPPTELRHGAVRRILLPGGARLSRVELRPPELPA